MLLEKNIRKRETIASYFISEVDERVKILINFCIKILNGSGMDSVICWSIIEGDYIATCSLSPCNILPFRQYFHLDVFLEVHNKRITCSVESPYLVKFSPVQFFTIFDFM